MVKPIERLRVSSYSKATTSLEQSFYGRFIADLVGHRRAKGWTQEHLDHRLGIASGLIAKWETFQSLPGAFMLMCWCMELGVNMTAQALQTEDELSCPDTALETDDVPVRRSAP